VDRDYDMLVSAKFIARKDMTFKQLAMIFYTGGDQWFCVYGYYRRVRFLIWFLIVMECRYGRMRTLLEKAFCQARFESEHEPNQHHHRVNFIQLWMASPDVFLPRLTNLPAVRLFTRGQQQINDKLQQYSFQKTKDVSDAAQSIAKLFSFGSRLATGAISFEPRRHEIRSATEPDVPIVPDGYPVTFGWKLTKDVWNKAIGEEAMKEHFGNAYDQVGAAFETAFDRLCKAQQVIVQTHLQLDTADIFIIVRFPSRIC
jgi:hypothetical protein